MTGHDIMRQFLPRSPHSSSLGIELIAITANRAELHLPFKPTLTTIEVTVHGGVIATLADCAIMCAAWATENPPANLRGVTVSLAVSYLDSAKAEDLTAIGVVLRRGRNLTTCRADVHGADSRVVACALGTYKLG